MPAKRKKNPSAKSQLADRRWLWGVGLIGLALAAVAIVVAVNRRPVPSKPGDFAVGPVTFCRIVPPFARALGYSESSVLDTVGQRKGLVLYDPPASGAEALNVYQHPTWDDAGYLSPVSPDKRGNIFVAPAPRISLYDNPPATQNTIYRVEAATGELAEFITLPVASAPEANPYGILGLAYDCNTDNLYASSVAGSTRTTESGHIYQIDPLTGRVVSQLEDVDAFGIVIFNGVSGKRLYYGSARTPGVYSVALDTQGRFAGLPRREFSMEGWGAEGDDKARRLAINEQNVMTVRGVEFNFNLIATSERQQTDYRLQYDPQTDSWAIIP